MYQHYEMLVAIEQQQRRQAAVGRRGVRSPWARRAGDVLIAVGAALAAVGTRLRGPVAPAAGCRAA